MTNRTKGHKNIEEADGFEDKYNGWSNYETWNVSLWIGNDEGLYKFAKGFETYQDFARALINMHSEIRVNNDPAQTPDGVPWNHPDLDIEALDEMIQEL